MSSLLTRQKKCRENKTYIALVSFNNTGTVIIVHQHIFYIIYADCVCNADEKILPLAKMYSLWEAISYGIVP